MFNLRNFIISVSVTAVIWVLLLFLGIQISRIFTFIAFVYELFLVPIIILVVSRSSNRDTRILQQIPFIFLLLAGSWVVFGGMSCFLVNIYTNFEDMMDEVSSTVILAGALILPHIGLSLAVVLYYLNKERDGHRAKQKEQEYERLVNERKLISSEFVEGVFDIICPQCEKLNSYSITNYGKKHRLPCPNCHTIFRSQVVKIRHKRARNIRQYGKRFYDVRVYYFSGEEDMISFEDRKYSDIEMKSGDLVVFTYWGWNDTLRIIQNLTIGRWCKPRR